jgi:hypothetical protein
MIPLHPVVITPKRLSTAKCPLWEETHLPQLRLTELEGPRFLKAAETTVASFKVEDSAPGCIITALFVLWFLLLFCHRADQIHFSWASSPKILMFKCRVLFCLCLYSLGMFAFITSHKSQGFCK